jgi:hypothetical protein
VKIIHLSSLAAIGVGVVLCGPVRGESVLTFEEFGNSLTPLANYGGFQWTNMYALDVSSYQADWGFYHSAVSGNHVATNWGGTESVSSAEKSAFTFESADFTTGWTGNLDVTVKGYRGDSLIDSVTFTVNSGAPTLKQFDLPDITKLTFQASAPFAMDNFAYDNVLTFDAPTATPTPGVLYGGLGLLTLMGGWQVIRPRATPQPGL